MTISPHPFPDPLKFGDEKQIEVYRRMEAEKEACLLVRAAEKHPYFDTALIKEGIVEEKTLYVLSE